jgi:DNA-binding transcriptional ArsR family regulator
LEKAALILEEQIERISDPTLQETYRTGRCFNRGITEALANLPSSGCLLVELAHADVPAHRPSPPEETVTLIWTVDAGEPDAALARQEDKVALRRHRILRLLAETEAAGGLPTVVDLAGALDVSPRTINGDLAALRRQGHPVRTRGHRA